MTERQQEEVGYKKPPRATQFRPGRSGNPKGRPRRPATNAEILAKISSEKIRMVINGKPRWVSPFEAAARQTLNACLAKGRPADLERLFKFLKEEGFDWRKEMYEENERSVEAGMAKLMAIVDRVVPDKGEGAAEK